MPCVKAVCKVPLARSTLNWSYLLKQRVWLSWEVGGVCSFPWGHLITSLSARSWHPSLSPFIGFGQTWSRCCLQAHITGCLLFPADNTMGLWKKCHTLEFNWTLDGASTQRVYHKCPSYLLILHSTVSQSSPKPPGSGFISHPRLISTAAFNHVAH